MSDEKGGNMIKRLAITFEDGAKTYGDLDADSEVPTITVGGVPYDLRWRSTPRTR